eukprot:403360073
MQFLKNQDALTISNNILIKQEDIKVLVLDRDNQVIEDDVETQIIIQSKFLNASVVGEPIFTVKNGVGYPQISIVGEPGSKMILTIQSLTDQQILGDSKILNILPCQFGQVLQNGLCISCGYGTFIIKENQKACLRCPSNAVCNGGSSLEPLNLEVFRTVIKDIEAQYASNALDGIQMLRNILQKLAKINVKNVDRFWRRVSL